MNGLNMETFAVLLWPGEEGLYYNKNISLKFTKVP